EHRSSGRKRHPLAVASPSRDSQRLSACSLCFFHCSAPSIIREWNSLVLAPSHSRVNGASWNLRRGPTMASSALPLSALIELCRSLRHYLAAGLSLVDVFRQQAKRGPSAVRSVAESIAKDLEHGHDLERALKKQKAAFPPLFLSLASVGE